MIMFLVTMIRYLVAGIMFFLPEDYLFTLYNLEQGYLTESAVRATVSLIYQGTLAI